MAGSGSMVCGADILNYILMRIWFILLVLVIIVKIGSLLKFPGLDSLIQKVVILIPNDIMRS